MEQYTTGITQPSALDLAMRAAYIEFPRARSLELCMRTRSTSLLRWWLHKENHVVYADSQAAPQANANIYPEGQDVVVNADSLGVGVK